MSVKPPLAQGMSFLLSWTPPAVPRGKQDCIVFHRLPQETWYHSQTKGGKLTDLLRWVWLQHTPRCSAPVEKALTGSCSVLSCLHCPCSQLISADNICSSPASDLTNVACLPCQLGVCLDVKKQQRQGKRVGITGLPLLLFHAVYSTRLSPSEKLKWSEG